MNIGAIACGLVGVAAVVAGFYSSGDKALGFWLIAVFALIGASRA